MTVAQIEAGLASGALSWDKALADLMDIRTSLTPELASLALINALQAAYSSLDDQAQRDTLTAGWVNIPADIQEKVLSGVYTGPDGPTTTTKITTPVDTAIGPYGLTTKQVQDALTQDTAQRRRLFEGMIGTDIPQLRSFLERRFDPLEAQFLLRQEQQPGFGLGGEELSFADFLADPGTTTLDQDVQSILTQLRDPSQQSTFLDSLRQGSQTAWQAGYQNRLSAVPQSLQSFVAGRQNFRDVENLLNEALGHAQGFERFATPGAAGNLTNLLGEIEKVGAFSGGAFPALEEHANLGIPQAFTSFLDALDPRTKGQDEQAGAFNIALQSVLQNTPVPFRSAVAQRAAREFDQFLLQKPGQAFLPHFLQYKRFS